jgi:hypothetical protein
VSSVGPTAIMTDGNSSANEKQGRLFRKSEACANCTCCVLIALLVPLIVYLSRCDYGACENDATCDGLFGECGCTGNHLGEYCEHSCGEFGQVSGGACVCSGNRTGTFCELHPGEIGDDDEQEAEEASSLCHPSLPSGLCTTCLVVAAGGLSIGCGVFVIAWCRCAAEMSPDRDVIERILDPLMHLIDFSGVLGSPPDGPTSQVAAGLCLMLCGGIGYAVYRGGLVVLACVMLCGVISVWYLK